MSKDSFSASQMPSTMSGLQKIVVVDSLSNNINYSCRLLSIVDGRLLSIPLFFLVVDDLLCLMPFIQVLRWVCLLELASVEPC
jgi:hypothetical protein